MTDTSFYTRFVQKRLGEVLADTPVVLVHGPTILASLSAANIHVSD